MLSVYNKLLYKLFCFGQRKLGSL